MARMVMITRHSLRWAIVVLCKNSPLPLFSDVFIISKLFFLLLSLSVSTVAMSHGGGLNAEGCHNNRRTGDYHCHRAPVVAPLAQKTNQLPSSKRYEPVCHVGPRGGTYTITPSGRKNYNGC